MRQIVQLKVPHQRTLHGRGRNGTKSDHTPQGDNHWRMNEASNRPQTGTSGMSIYVALPFVIQNLYTHTTHQYEDACEVVLDLYK